MNIAYRLDLNDPRIVAAIEDVLNAALVWAWCPPHGGYAEDIENDLPGPSIEDTCESLNMVVAELCSLLGETRTDQYVPISVVPFVELPRKE